MARVIHRYLGTSCDLADIFGISESDCESEGKSSRLHSLLPQLKEMSTTDYSSLRILAKNILAGISSD